MQTPLYSLHLDAGAKVVDFHGWEMPLHYGSQIEEHLAVRRHAGVFDVSHMTIVDVEGEQAQAYLRRLLANDVANMSLYQAMYSCMLNEQGGVVDDLICYQLATNHYRLVVNSATKEKDLAWLNQQALDFDIKLTHLSDLAILAIQGPNALDLLKQSVASLSEPLAALKPFHCVAVEDWLIARTGYTGEDGAEIMLPVTAAIDLWQQLLTLGVKPCGLGARDTLRLESGLNLYGQDMDEATSPLVANLAWTIVFDAKDRRFVGQEALEAQKAQGIEQRLVGLVLKDKGVLRQGQKVIVDNVGEGMITSGGFSPTMEKGIAFARVPIVKNSADWGQTFVEIRGKLKPVEVVKLPFVRKGRVIYQPLNVGESV